MGNEEGTRTRKVDVIGVLFSATFLRASFSHLFFGLLSRSGRASERSVNRLGIFTRKASNSIPLLLSFLCRSYAALKGLFIQLLGLCTLVSVSLGGSGRNLNNS